jgi:hypothetical protein
MASSSNDAPTEAPQLFVGVRKAPTVRSYLSEEAGVPEELLDECATVQEMIGVAQLHIQIKKHKHAPPSPFSEKQGWIFAFFALNFVMCTMLMFGSGIQFDGLNENDTRDVWRGLRRVQDAGEMLRLIVFVIYAQVMAAAMTFL